MATHAYLIKIIKYMYYMLLIHIIYIENIIC
jgi:hypothetical protein